MEKQIYLQHITLGDEYQRGRVDIEPRYDGFGVPLTQSGISERIWDLCLEDLDEFERAIKAYFQKAYSGFSVVDTDYANRVVWLKDERRRKREKR